MTYIVELREEKGYRIKVIEAESLENATEILSENYSSEDIISISEFKMPVKNNPPKMIR